MAVSKLKVGELRAECVARGLPSEGSRSTIQQYVMKARRANPLIADEIRRGRTIARKEKKIKKLRAKSSKVKAKASSFPLLEHSF